MLKLLCTLPASTVQMASAPQHEWSQTEAEIVVKFPLAPNVSKDSLRIKFETTKLTVRAGGSAIFERELAGKLNTDECYWQLENQGDSRVIVVTLTKKKGASWKTLTADEAEQLPPKDVLDDDFDVMNLEHDDDDPERVEEQEENERKLEARYKKLASEKGLNHEDTLETFFALFDNCIQLYRLNKLSDYLEDVVPVCRKRDDKYKLKGIQALAFVRWKQSRFRDALPLFHEMEGILGKSAALCENIAHTYNSLGDYEKAEDYFRQALRFIEQESGMNRGNRGGVLLGLGLVRDRLGKHKEALPVCLKAYEFYKDRANGAPASLQAKAGISCAKLHAKLGDLPKAESFIREAVQMYEVTCGETSPLTASAYHELGKCLWAQRKREDARKALQRAYELEAMKDAWDLITILEIHNILMDTHLKETQHIERSRFSDHIKTVDYVVNRVRKELPQDGNAAVYYKAAAELKAWGGRYADAKALFDMAVPLLKAEKSTDCSGLIQGCQDMIAFCDRNLAGTQDSPMDFELPSDKVAKDEAEGQLNGHSKKQVNTMNSEGVTIEELEPEPMDVSPKEADPSPSSPAGHPSRKPRALVDADWTNLVHLCVRANRPPVINTQARFKALVQGSGAGLCWAVDLQGGGLSGVVLCSSNTVQCNIMQLVSEEGPHQAQVDSALLQKIDEACSSLELKPTIEVRNGASHNEEMIAKKLGLQATGKLFSLPPKETSGAAASSSAASGAYPATSSASSYKPINEAAAVLRRDGKDVGSFYNAWDKLSVEKALVQEEGLDPSIVPEARAPQDQFGLETTLDVASRISSYSWDQSDRFVSLYVPFNGVGSLDQSAVEVIFRPRGVLLIISSGGKQHWYKVPNLCHEIDCEASKKTIKQDQVVMKLRKQAEGVQWSDLTDDKDKYQQKREYRINHGDLKGATTEELLADMYRNASDEDRAGLRDAMRVNREKREEDAKRARGSES